MSGIPGAAGPPNSRRAASIRSLIVTRSTVPAAFPSLDTIAVLTSPLLPAFTSKKRVTSRKRARAGALCGGVLDDVVVVLLGDARATQE